MPQGRQLSGGRPSDELPRSRADAGRSSALLDETDFSGANLNEADLSDWTSRPVFLRGRLPQGRLMNSDLEGMCLDRLDFSGARLEGCILTGTSMVRGNLAGACLRGTGLATSIGRGASRGRLAGSHVSHGLVAERTRRFDHRVRGEPHRLLHRRIPRTGFQIAGGDPQSQPVFCRPARTPSTGSTSTWSTSAAPATTPGRRPTSADRAILEDRCSS